MAYVGITSNGELVMKDKSGRFFIAGQYAKAAFNNNIDGSFNLIEKYEIDGIGTVSDKRTVQGKMIDNKIIKTLKFEI
jgi:hypothetical protein